MTILVKDKDGNVLELRKGQTLEEAVAKIQKEQDESLCMRDVVNKKKGAK